MLRIRRALRNWRRKRFSIITPTFNSGPKLEATINSVLSQNEKLFEYIIVDGGSTDETLNTIGKYGERIKWISEKDRGVYDAMNKGIKMAKGQYLYFLGAGDLMRAKILDRVDHLLPYEPLGFLYGNVYLVGGDVVYLGEFDDDKIAKSNICHQSIFYERHIFDLIGMFDLRYSKLADYAFNLKCFADKRIWKAYIAEIIADYEGGGLSTDVDVNFLKDFHREK
jgi:glycosyltransferase involved in cell wall biosynthesis